MHGYAGVPEVEGDCYNCAHFYDRDCPMPQYVECMFYRNDNFTEEEWRQECKNETIANTKLAY